jgi:hypothetical protein
MDERSDSRDPGQEADPPNEQPESMEKPTFHKRRIRLIKPRLQLRLIGAFAGLCALALLVHTLMVGALLMSVAGKLPQAGMHLANALPAALGEALFWSFFLLLPSLLLIGVHLTFKIAGPLFRFERHLGEVVRGEEPGPCRLRKTDDLQELCALLNQALESERARDPRRAEPEKISERAA